MLMMLLTDAYFFLFSVSYIFTAGFDCTGWWRYIWIHLQRRGKRHRYKNRPRASDFFQDWWAKVTHGAKNGGPFSEMMCPSISN